MSSRTTPPRSAGGESATVGERGRERLSRARQPAVLLIRSGRQQDPDRVNAQGCANGEIDQADEAQHESERPRPGFPLQQTPPGRKPCQSLEQEKQPQGREQSPEEGGGRHRSRESLQV